MCFMTLDKVVLQYLLVSISNKYKSSEAFYVFCHAKNKLYLQTKILQMFFLNLGEITELGSSGYLSYTADRGQAS